MTSIAFICGVSMEEDECWGGPPAGMLPLEDRK